MDNQDRGQQVSPAIRALYPTLTETELKEAEANLRRYFEIASEIVRERDLRGVNFDSLPDPATMEERSNGSLKT